MTTTSSDEPAPSGRPLFAPIVEMRRAARRWSDPYLLGSGPLLRRLPAIVPVGIYLGVAWGGLGAGLNVPAVLWNAGETGATGVLAGASTAVLFTYLWTLTYLLDATFDPHRGPRGGGRVARGLARMGPAAADPAAARLWGYLSVTLVPSVALLALAAVARAEADPPFLSLYPGGTYSDNDRLLLSDRWPFLLGLAIGLGALWAARRAAGWAFVHWSGFVGRYSPLAWLTGASDRWVRAAVVGLFTAQAAAFVACLLAFERGAWSPPPVLAVNTLFAVVAGVCGGVWYYFRGAAAPAFLVLLGWLYYANADPYKLRFPHLEPEYAALGTAAEVRLQDFDTPSADWDAIVVDERDAEWDRVARLTAHRAAPLAGEHGDRVRGRLAELAKVPERNAENYRELLGAYSLALAAAEFAEWEGLERWRAAAPRRGAAAKPKLAVVTVTGGANRSALWTATVLAELDRELPGFPRHVRLIAGASGGMVGAGYYAASVGEGGLPPDFDPLDVAQDHLVPVLDSLAFREVPLLLSPATYSRDRGHTLDLSLEGSGTHLAPDVRARLGRAFGRTFADLKPGEDAGWRPPLVFTPMTVEDGRRLVISNRDLHPLTLSSGNMLSQEPPHKAEADASGRSGAAAGQSRGVKQVPEIVHERVPVTRIEDAPQGPRPVTSYTLLTKSFRGADATDVYGRSAVEFFQLFPAARGRFRLSTAARMNATFPVVSPAVDLPTVPPRRVVDAGYYDNYGVGVAAGWLLHHRDWVRDNTSGVVVIQVRDSASNHDRRHLTLTAERGKEGPAAGGSSPLAWLTGPLAAANVARQTTTSFRNDALLTALSRYFRDAVPGDPEFFQTVVFERYTDVGMSWFLSDRDKAEIARSWADERLPGNLRNYNPGSLKLLKDWWAR